jgi:hypothetical protein
LTPTERETCKQKKQKQKEKQKVKKTCDKFFCLKKTQNSRNQGFPYFFLLDNGTIRIHTNNDRSVSERAKNLRIQIHNTVKRKNKDGGKRQTYWDSLLVAGRLVLGGRAPEEEQKVSKSCEK